MEKEINTLELVNALRFELSSATIDAIRYLAKQPDGLDYLLYWTDEPVVDYYPD